MAVKLLYSAAVAVVASAACHVYDDSLVGLSDADEGTGGSFAAGGTGATAGAAGASGSSSTASGGTTSGGAAAGGAGGASNATGGSSGSATGGGAGASTTDYSIIDDMDDGDNILLPNAAREGYWYAYDDGSGGTALPIEGGPFDMVLRADEPGNYAIHFIATGFSSWGAGVGANVSDPSGVTGPFPYDATDYDGVSFWARIEANSQSLIRLGVADVNSDAGGGVCDAAAGTCGDHHGKSLTITSEWAHYHLAFADMNRLGFGPSEGATFRQDEVYGIHFTAKVTANDLDIWIDEVAFFSGDAP